MLIVIVVGINTSLYTSKKVNAFVLISNGIKDVGSLICYKGLLLARFAWYLLDQPILIAPVIGKTVCTSKKCIRLY